MPVNPALHAPDRLDEQGMQLLMGVSTLVASWTAHFVCRGKIITEERAVAILMEEDEPFEGKYDWQPLIQLRADRNALFYHNDMVMKLPKI